LEGIPFGYLVPDERMLSIESLRFSYVDPLWVECLLDGAFSIGRVLSTDRQLDEKMAGMVATPHPKVSGFVLRFEVIAGWPGLLVEAYGDVISTDTFDPHADTLPLLRMTVYRPTSCSVYLPARCRRLIYIRCQRCCILAWI
jgi:hypothetical protein